MIVFNDQCYGVQCFDYHRNQCHRKNQRRAQSNYTTNISIFKDPRTGTDFDFTFATESMYYRRLTQSQLRQIIVARYPVLTFAQTLEFLPPWNGNMKVDEFVTHIKNLAELRQPERDLYDEAICNRQSVANNALPIQVIVPARYVPPPPLPLVDNPPPVREQGNELEAPRVQYMRNLAVLDGGSISSDSSET